MSSFWSIVKRETDERRLLLPGALILGLMPYAVSLLPGDTARDLAGGRFELAIVLALVATGVTALFLGASVIARDLAERRLSFYFARPLSSGTIWGGKMTAAAGLSLATGALVLLPALLIDTRPQEGWPPGWMVAYALAALLALLGLGHAVSLLLRIRSAWLLLDLAGGLAFWLLLLAARAPLAQLGIPEFQAGSPSVIVRGYLALNVIAILAVLTAGAVQIAVGRTDPRRGHKALSLTLWGLLLLIALLFVGFSRWVTNVDPRDLERVTETQAAPAGSWILISGPARHRPGFFPVFLKDTSNGRAVRIDLPSIPGRRLTVHFSGDGRRAVWADADRRLVLLDLGRPGSRPLVTSLSLTPANRGLVLSEDGSRIAMPSNDRVLVYGLPQGEILASQSFPGPPASIEVLEFQDLDHLAITRSTLEASGNWIDSRHELEISTQSLKNLEL